MFTKMLAVQWKWTKGAAFIATVIGFLIPIASVQSIEGAIGYFASPVQIVASMQAFGVGYAMLAAGTGLSFAILAWSQDHRTHHVYALSLPVSRAKYSAMRFGAGALFLLLPAAGVLIGSLVGLAVVHLPAGLHGYPIALTLRFLFASGVAFAIFFAIASSTQRTAGIALGAIAGVLLAAFVLSLTWRYDLLSPVGTVLFNAPGLLAVFSGRWMLIDV